MRFSLRTLLLLFPALILSYALAYGCIPRIYTTRGVRSIWSQENLRLRQLQCISEEKFQVSTRLSLAPAIDGYQQGKVSLPATLTTAWDTQLGKSWQDSWGHPYHSVILVDRLHCYSCGQDGISLTAGNDPDDLNTWDEHAHEFYSEQAMESRRREQRLERLWFMPLTTAFVFGCWVIFGKFVA